MKKVYSASDITMQSEKRKQDKRLAKKRDDPFFRSQLQSIRQKISGGQSLFDIRHSMEIKDNTKWTDLITCLSRSVLSPESCVLEWTVRQSSRYSMTADFLNRSKAAGDRDNEAKAIMMLCKIDQEMFELQKAFGLIRPIETDNEGLGYSSDDLNAAQERMEQLAEQRLLNKLTSERETQSPQSVTLLPGFGPGREADPVGPAPLAKDNPDGPLPGPQNHEGLTNGGFNTMPDQIILDVQSKNNT